VDSRFSHCSLGSRSRESWACVLSTVVVYFEIQTQLRVETATAAVAVIGRRS